MDISAQSKLFDVINAYPDLEKFIVDLAPPFKNLKNPVLRKTVGKLATLEKIGGTAVHSRWYGNAEPRRASAAEGESADA
jgi:hypothetical protein